VTPASAGACVAAPPSTSLVTLACNATVSVNESTTLSSVIAFPQSLNVTDTVPLLFLPSASPLNAEGVDIILASAPACAAYAALGGATQCAMGRAYAVDGAIRFFLGPAAALGMAPAPLCAA